MKCFYCSSEQSSVIDKRTVKSTGEIRRRRECMKCQRRYTTYERVCAYELYVIKRDGRRELYSREKLRGGLARALEKRPGVDKIEEVVDKIEIRLKLKGLKEVESKTIGRAVLVELKKLDQIAYLRFVSVYRKFSGVDDFAKELQTLI